MNESEKRIIELRFAHEQEQEARAQRLSKRIAYPFLVFGLICGFFISFFSWIIYAPYLRAACVFGWVLSVIMYLELYLIPKEKSVAVALGRLTCEDRIKLGILLICMPVVGRIINLLLRHIILKINT